MAGRRERSIDCPLPVSYIHPRTSGAADLSLTLTNETLTSSSKIATLQNKTGTVALTSDVPVKANSTEVNAGSDDAKFVTSYALNGSNYLNDTKAINLTDIADTEIDLDNHSLILIDTGDSTLKKLPLLI